MSRENATGLERIPTCTNGTDCIIDVRVTDLDAKCDRNMDPEKVKQKHEKKKKYLQACLAQRRHFAPFVASTDGMLSKESKTLLKKLSSLLADKWEKTVSRGLRLCQCSHDEHRHIPCHAPMHTGL